MALEIRQYRAEDYERINALRWEALRCIDACRCQIEVARSS
jgi:hypothetical protein